MVYDFTELPRSENTGSVCSVAEATPRMVSYPTARDSTSGLARIQHVPVLLSNPLSLMNQHRPLYL